MSSDWEGNGRLEARAGMSSKRDDIEAVERAGKRRGSMRGKLRVDKERQPRTKSFLQNVGVYDLEKAMGC